MSPTPPTTTPPPLPTYLCTFCWRPHHAGVTPSRVVGHHARLACQPCYGALLDLAVCWVCGEVVFRGDECVSLGWCFWHRACYGCLMCGDRRVVLGATVEEVFDGRRSGGGGGGEEVEEVPLCARCVEETERDRVDEDRLIPTALERVDRFDGGLSRRRWESRRQQEQQQEHQQSSVFSGPDRHLHQGLEADPRSPSPIYVSMRDPLGEPAFKRSQTKPIPRWMQYLPNQRQATMGCPEPRSGSILDSCFKQPALGPVCSDFETEEPPPPAPSTYTPIQMSRPFTLIAEEPVQRPSSTKAANKHVRFTTSTSYHPPDGAFDEGYNAPSEPLVFLDRCQIPSAMGGSSTKCSTRPVVASHLAEHHVRRVSPFLRH